MFNCRFLTKIFLRVVSVTHPLYKSRIQIILTEIILTDGFHNGWRTELEDDDRDLEGLDDSFEDPYKRSERTENIKPIIYQLYFS